MESVIPLIAIGLAVIAVLAPAMRRRRTGETTAIVADSPGRRSAMRNRKCFFDRMENRSGGSGCAR